MGLFSFLFKKDEGVGGKTKSSGVKLNKFGEETTGDNSDCHGNTRIIRERIEKVLSQKYPGYYVKDGYSLAEYGVFPKNNNVKKNVDLILTNPAGKEIAIIIFLRSEMFRAPWCKELYKSVSLKGMESIHFFIHLPNRICYIEKRLAEFLG